MTRKQLNRLLGLKIQNLRRQKGMSQAELAAAIRKSEDTISNIERGASSSRISTVHQIASILGATLPELFDFDTVPPADREFRRAVNDIVRLLNSQTLGSVKLVRKVLGVVFPAATETK